MNIEDALRERLTERSSDVPGGPSLSRAIERGRARRRRRAAARSGLATMCAMGVVGAAAMVGVGPFGGAGTPQDGDRAWALAVPPEDVPAAIDRAVREQLPDGATITHREIGVYADGDRPLPRDRWDEGTDWYVTYMLGSGESVSVSMLHAASETEGDPSQICREDVSSGIYLSCRFSEEGGVEVFEREGALRNEARPGASTPGPWRALLPAGRSTPGNPDVDDVDPGRIWFSRDVEAQPGGDYLVQVSDYVHAPTHQGAKAEWTFGVERLREIALSDELLSDPAPTDSDDSTGVTEGDIHVAPGRQG